MRLLARANTSESPPVKCTHSPSRQHRWHPPQVYLVRGWHAHDSPKLGGVHAGLLVAHSAVGRNAAAAALFETIAGSFYQEAQSIARRSLTTGSAYKWVAFDASRRFFSWMVLNRPAELLSNTRKVGAIWSRLYSDDSPSGQPSPASKLALGWAQASPSLRRLA